MAEFNGVIYPLWYHNKKGENDLKWILQRMAVIPKSKQQEVADQYERLFIKNKPFGRKPANEYLHSVAVEYRDKRKKGMPNVRS